MPKPPRYDVRAEYAAWTATPKRLKTRLKLPVTKKDFADMKGVSDRTLRRWELQESFQDLVHQRRMEIRNAGPNSAVEAVGPPRPATHGTALKKFELPEPVSAKDDPVYDERLSPDEQKYAQVKDTLVEMAMSGNQGAIDLYMKHYGKPFIEAEQKAGSMFPNMSDSELEWEICSLLGQDAVSRYLTELATA